MRMESEGSNLERRYDGRAVFVYWNNIDKTQVAEAVSVRKYRTHLRINVCSDFGLVWDVHDGHKHAILTRDNRQVTYATQTGVRHRTIGQIRFNEVTFNAGPEIVIQLDDGTRRSLALAMHNVMAMWEKLLLDMRL